MFLLLVWLKGADLRIWICISGILFSLFLFNDILQLQSLVPCRSFSVLLCVLKNQFIFLRCPFFAFLWQIFRLTYNESCFSDPFRSMPAHKDLWGPAFKDLFRLANKDPRGLAKMGSSGYASNIWTLCIGKLRNIPDQHPSRIVKLGPLTIGKNGTRPDCRKWDAFERAKMRPFRIGETGTLPRSQNQEISQMKPFRIREMGFFPITFAKFIPRGVRY